jgi:hypothetical protein
VTTQNGKGENDGVYFTKESIYLLKTHHTFTLTLKAALQIAMNLSVRTHQEI